LSGHHANARAEASAIVRRQPKFANTWSDFIGMQTGDAAAAAAGANAAGLNHGPPLAGAP
jgi:hypothetical protein